MTIDLDGIDRRILRNLQQDGRLTNAELAKRSHVSPATCHRRTQRLFDEGYIRSVRTEVVPERVDLGTLVVVGVVLDRSTPESFAAFEAAVTGALPVVPGMPPGRRRLRLLPQDPGQATSPTSTACTASSLITPCPASARPAPSSS